MLALVLLFLAIGYYYFFYMKTKDFLNPTGLMLSVWTFTAALSALYLAPLQQKWGIEMIFVVISSSIAIFFAGYIFLPKQIINNSVKEPTITNGFIILTRLIFFVSLLCVLIEWRYNGFILPGLNFNSDGLDTKSLVLAIPGVHYGSIIMPYCGIYAFFELKYTKGKKWFPILVMVVSIFFYSVMIVISRGNLLTIFLGILFIQNRKQKLSLKNILIFLAIVLIIFIGIASIRIPEGSLVINSLGSDKIIYRYISPIYTYVGYSFENLNKLTDSDNTYSFVKYTFKSILDLFGFRESLNLTTFNTIFFNTRTYLYAFYADLGIIGTVIYPFLLGSIIAIIYKKSFHNTAYILILSVMQKAIVTLFFGDYFASELVILWPYFITLVVMISLRYNVSYRKKNKNYEI